MNLLRHFSKTLLIGAFLSVFAFKANAVAITLNCTSLNGKTYHQNDPLKVYFTVGNFYNLFDDYLIGIGTASNMSNEVIIGGSESNTDFQPTGTIPANLPCGDYYVRITGRLTTGSYVYSNICGTIHVTGCNDGTNMDKAIDLGTICTKTLDQVDNSQSKYSDNYSTDKPHGQASKDIWYKFKPQNTARFQISTCGSCMDTYIHLLDEFGNEIAYNDDQNVNSWLTSSTCPTSYLISMINSKSTGYSNMPLSLMKDKTYYLVLEGYNMNQGCINAQINCCLPCTNNGDGSSYENAYDLCYISCSSPQVFTDTKNSSLGVFHNTYDATINPTLMPHGQASNDIWYAFTATENLSNWTINTCGSGLYDTYIHVLTADKTEITFNDDYNGCNHQDPLYSPYASSVNGFQNSTVLLAGKTYYVVVEGYGSSQGSITTSFYFCPAFNVTAESAVKPLDSEQKEAKIFTLKVAPNPFTTTTTLKIDGGDGNIKIEIADVNGAVVYKKERYQADETITLGENFPAGVYFVRVNDNTETQVMKLVKLH